DAQRRHLGDRPAAPGRPGRGDPMTADRPVPVVPDDAGLLADLVQAEADLDLIDPGEHGYTVALDADGQPDECVDDCPACAAERIRAVLAVVGQGVTAAEVRERLADAWD